jgi:hypothetical protein
VVSVLWRDGMVPQWIDISPWGASEYSTYFELTCCGRLPAEPTFFTTTGPTSPRSRQETAVAITDQFAERSLAPAVVSIESCGGGAPLIKGLIHPESLFHSDVSDELVPNSCHDIGREGPTLIEAGNG